MIELALAAGAAVIASFLAFLKGQSSGAAKNEAKHQAARSKAIDTKKEIRDEVENLDPASLDARFERWRLPDDTKR